MIRLPRTYIVVVLGVVGVSVSTPLVKMALEDMPPAAIAAYRLSFSSLLLLPSAAKGRAYLRSLTRKEVCLLLLSALFLALHFYCWFSSLTMTSAFSSVVLVSLQPIFVTGLSYLLWRRRLPHASYWGAAVTIAGALVVGISSFGMNASLHLRGDLLALAGALCMAAYLLCGNVLRQKLPTGVYACSVYSLCALCLLIFMCSTGVKLFQYSPRSLIDCACLAVFCTLCGHTLFQYALKHVSASVVSFALLGEPIGAALFTFLLFGQAPTLLALVGGCITILGLVLYLRGETKQLT